MPSDYYRALHEEYLKNLTLRYSILLKSAPELSGAEPNDILRLRLNCDLKVEARALLSEIRLHEIFFSSFGSGPVFYRARIPGFPSAESLLYNIRKKSLAMNAGFVTLSRRRGEVCILADHDPTAHFKCGVPTLAIDLWEHAYFGDFGFSREGYLDALLPRLRLDKLLADSH